MPATDAGMPGRPFVLGVDGCKAGWVAAALSLEDGAVSARIFPDFETLMRGPGAAAAMIMIDMPIGLAEDGPRACEALARGLLKPLRHSSVFSSPRRPMLAFNDYAAANAWGKAQANSAGLSKQAWMIAPKIREVDAITTPADQSRLGEAHPEIAFYRMNDGAPCLHAKRTPEGAAERLRLLRRHGAGNAEDLFLALKKDHGRGVGADDVYDACALACTAKARLEGGAVHLTDGARDARGLMMEIWG